MDMENQNKVNPNLEIAVQVQQKFDFYFLALVFTILGLTVQTSTITGKYQCFFEIASWILLLASGLAGLSRLAWRPVFYMQADFIQRKENDIRALEESRISGKPVIKPSGEYWTQEELFGEQTKLEQSISAVEERKNKIEKRLKWKYLIHKWCFAAGICLLLLSRAITALNKFCIYC
jgi:hypothetical protein